MIELMVVVAIIALLIGLMIPAISSVQRRSKIVSTQSQFTAIDLGLSSYLTDNIGGGAYPPSATDAPAANYGNMADPIANAQATIGPISGANLLVYTLLGADLLGTPGFRDLDGDGAWWNDTYRVAGGLYELNAATGDPVAPRYGPYGDDTMIQTVSTLNRLQEDGVLLSAVPPGIGDQKLFVDPFGTPILYYRARRAARPMITNPGGGAGAGAIVGVYDHRDNGVITGSEALATAGLDFGAGADHTIAKSEYPDPVPADADNNGVLDVLEDPAFDNTFERFIVDPLVTMRNVPVNREKYLLISAGPDGRYGTEDDVVNWDRS